MLGAPLGSPQYQEFKRWETVENKKMNVQALELMSRQNVAITINQDLT